MKAGDVLVPRETPLGPAAAREAWADALGNLLVVVQAHGSGVVEVNCPADGANYTRSTSDILAEYEPSAGEEVVPGRGIGRTWAATVARAAMECAKVVHDERGEAFYWQRVATAARKVFEEEATG